MDERNDAQVSAVHGLLHSVRKVTEQLRHVLRSYEQQMGCAGLAFDGFDDLLDRQFWATVPDRAKQQILLSPDSWCVPHKSVRSFTEGLLERGEAEMAGQVLRNYSARLEGATPEAQAKIGAGLENLADIYARLGTGVLDFAIHAVGMRLDCERDGELMAILAGAFAALSEKANDTYAYAAVQQSIAGLQHLEQHAPALARKLRTRLRVEDRIPALVAHALTMPQVPPELIRALRRITNEAAGSLAAQFAKSASRVQSGRLLSILHDLGPEAADHLRNKYRSASGEETLALTAAMSNIDVELVRECLAKRIAGWSRAMQDAVIRQIACGGSPNRGQLLAQLLDVLDPLVVPQALDEIGFSGAAPTAKLLEMARGESLGSSAYMRLKSIEALGRLKEHKAADVLLSVIADKTLWSFRHPRELRICAAQALHRIDPVAAQGVLRHSGLQPWELQFAAMDVANNKSWLRSRRYPRIRPEQPLQACATTAKERCTFTVERLSLSGGTGATLNHVEGAAEATLDLQIGVRPVVANVLIRETKPWNVVFEIMQIDLEQRSRLRQFLVAEMQRSRKGKGIGAS
jgi:hypothetical protein